MFLLASLVAVFAALLSYRLLEEWTRRTWVPAVLRAAGWALLAVLLVNASCPAPTSTGKPIVLLDASLSMQAAGGRWREALALARDLGSGGGEVRLVGVPAGDTLPAAGRTRLGPALRAAETSGRPVVVVSDGEVEDAADLAADSSAGPEIRIVRRRPARDLALTRVEGPTRLTPTDSLVLALEVTGSGLDSAAGEPGPRRVLVEAREAGKVWLRGSLGLDSGGRGAIRLAAPMPAVSPGPHVLTVAVTDAADAEPRDDARLFVVHLVPTPGVVLLASPPSWESRFLAATLREVAQLPVRGYLETEPGVWRRAGELLPASGKEVAEAARRADLLVTLGAPPGLGRASRARARWSWITSSDFASGDWYLSATSASPVSGGLAGLAVDSFPPGTGLADLVVHPGDWIGLSAQLGRRGAIRPVLIGRDSAGVREAVTGIEGLWRWAFRGGSSEQGYRSLVAGVVTWLLAGADSAGARARLRREVVPRGLPAVFEWAGGGDPVPLAITWVGDSGTRRDTLTFDGMGRAERFLPPGIWRYRLEGRGGGGAGAGVLAVETFSEEWIPRPPTLDERRGAAIQSRPRRPVRGWIWLFGLAVAAFSGEWIARRRLGLR